MSSFILLISLSLLAGAAGGLANYLSLDDNKDDPRNLISAARFMAVGSIAALTVPLFLSLAQSSLVSDIFTESNGKNPYYNTFLFIGFCIVAAFASRNFMSSLVEKLAQIEKKADLLENKTDHLTTKTKTIEETARTALDLNEETADRVEEANQAGSAKGSPFIATLPKDFNLSSIPNLDPAALNVLNAASRYTLRTQTGIARDAGIPRSEVGELVDRLANHGLLRFTTSPNTGGLRLSVTDLGAAALNKLRPTADVPDRAGEQDEKPAGDPPN